MALQKYTYNAFLYVLCSSGIAISISFFFLKGVEELSYPHGALIFHIDGIAKSFFLFFICTVPIIINQQGKQISNKSPIKTKRNLLQHQDKKELWEQATPEDIESGNYEPL